MTELVELDRAERLDGFERTDVRHGGEVLTRHKTRHFTSQWDIRPGGRDEALHGREPLGHC
jgi:hypothetical protein